MSSQSFIGIEVNDSEVEKIKNNRVSINSDTGKGIQVNRSKVGEIVGNQIISIGLTQRRPKASVTAHANNH